MNWKIWVLKHSLLNSKFTELWFTYYSPKMYFQRKWITKNMRALRAHVAPVPRALRTFISHVSRSLRGLMPHVSRVLLALVPHVISYLTCPSCLMLCTFHMPMSRSVLLCFHASRDFFCLFPLLIRIVKEGRVFIRNIVI